MKEEAKTKKAGKGDKKAAKRRFKVATPKIHGSKKRRGCTPIARYMRTGIKDHCAN